MAGPATKLKQKRTGPPKGRWGVAPRKEGPADDGVGGGRIYSVTGPATGGAQRSYCQPIRTEPSERSTNTAATAWPTDGSSLPSQDPMIVRSSCSASATWAVM